MHMAWVAQVGGRLKSDYRYSGSMVYNTYPWPQAPSAKQRTTVEAAARAVLDVREEYQERGDTLADLYDPIAMPAKLVKAHTALDPRWTAATAANPSRASAAGGNFFSRYTRNSPPR